MNRTQSTSRWQRSFLFVGLFLVASILWNCGGPPLDNQQNSNNGTQSNPLTECADNTTSPSPFFGPWTAQGALKTTAPEGEYFQVSTHMKVRMQSEKAVEEFQRIMDMIQKALPQQKGLLASSFYFSQSCGYARTLTIWQDYESMVRFVNSSAHAEAMANASVIASHFRTTHWKGNPQQWPVTWDKAVKALLPVEINVYKATTASAP
ncbi:MAG: hypothetical protein EP343_00400 [Deltaproteobacteria bacterium]|nr:MAG: hypothetical protein EP343_00400 [Deltaproteobacteria bacterium]